MELFSVYACVRMSVRVHAAAALCRVHPFDARMRRVELPPAEPWEVFKKLGCMISPSWCQNHLTSAAV